ncbi:MAG: aminotransferase class IV family protein [Gammaproteobacteria bacterium]|nr:aminotransferase class IV family protein [Gammaproteobacteria bacterium]
MNNDYICFNNQFIKHDLPCLLSNDRGLTLGDGVFETFLTHNGKMPFFKQHWERLLTSLAILDINLSVYYSSSEIIRDSIRKLLVLNNLLNKTAIIKIIITRGSGPRTLIPTNDFDYQPNIIISSLETNLFELKTKTLQVSQHHLVNPKSILNKIKSLNYLDKILAQKEAMRNNYDDALLSNFEQNICEATTSNIFFVTRDNHILTPCLKDGILPGITRKFVINSLIRLGFNISEQSVNLDLLISNKLNITEAFITNSVIGINSVTKINNFILDNTDFAKIAIDNLLSEYIGISKQCLD